MRGYYYKCSDIDYYHWVSDTDGSISFTCAPGNAGQKTAYAYAVDNAYWSDSTPSSFTYYTENVQPNTNYGSVSPSSWTNQDYVTITGTISDSGGSGLSGYYYRCYDGGIYSLVSDTDGSISFTCNYTGGQIASFYARDNAGNIDATPVTVNYYRDIIRPVAPTPTTEGTYSTDNSVYFYGTPTDSGGSGLRYCYAQVAANSTSNIVLDWYSVGTDGDYSYYGSNGNRYYYRYYCTDYAGNTSYWSNWSSSVLVDTTVPEASNITVNNVSKTIGETLTFYIIADDNESGLDRALFYLGNYPYSSWNKVNGATLTSEYSCSGTNSPVTGCASGKYYYYYSWTINE